MKFHQEHPDNGYHITSYGDHEVSINGRAFMTSMVIAPQQLIENWAPKSIDELTTEDIDVITQLEPELVILGTGTRLQFPDVGVYASLINAGIGVEVMDTGAACRTYNVLMGEGRKVIAGLII